MDDELAWALFFVSRRVRDVADDPPAGTARWTRTADVRAAAAGTPEIAADLLLLGAPRLSIGGVNGGRVAAASSRLADWAAERGYAELAIQLVEAAVAIRPTSARRTYAAARINRRFGRIDDAEILYARAISLARPGSHWWVYVRAHLGLGHVAKQRGQPERAAAHYATAARGARDRSGEKWLAAMIEHDLFALAAESGDVRRAHSHARRAFDWMPTHNERVPALVHDYAFLLLRAHALGLAMKLLERLVEKRLASVEMVLIWSTYGRAAGMLGHLQRFRTAEREVQALAPRFDANAAAAYVNLAAGAHLLGLRAEAEQHAARSLELARSRDEARIVADAAALLVEIRSDNPAPPPFEHDPPEPMHRLSRDLAERLSKWRGATWKRKSQSGKSRLGFV